MGTTEWWLGFLTGLCLVMGLILIFAAYTARKGK